MALWIIDTQPAQRLGLDGEAIVPVLHRLGHEVIETLYKPESDAPADLVAILRSGRPALLRGSVGFAAWAHDCYFVRPGAFRSEYTHASHYLPAYGDLALNAGAIITTYADFEAHRAGFEERLGGTIFVKPADGGKAIGGVVVRSGYQLWDAHFSRYRRWSELPPDYRLLLAPHRVLHREWRFVIAGSRIVASSQYKAGQFLETCPGAANGAHALAETIARHPWRPADVFVVDVAETEEGFFLLELNTFGTSGLYDCDLNAIVNAVSPYAE